MNSRPYLPARGPPLRGGTGGEADPTDLRAHVELRLRAVDRALARVSGRSVPTPEQLHRLHRELRRLRIELRVWRQLLSPAMKERARGYDARLDRISTLVGEIRDLDVRLEMIRRLRREPRPAKLRDRLAVAEAQLDADARTGRQLLRAFVRSERSSGLWTRAHELLGDLPRAPGVPDGERAIRRVRTRLVEGTSRAFRRARKRPSVRRLHRLRVAIRRSRHLSDLARAAAKGSIGPPFPSALARLQASLGRLHDQDILLEWLEGLGPFPPGWAGDEAEDRSRRTQFRRIRRSLESSEIRRAVRELREP